ncbi:MAG: single-stranded-DNA-specific exonuclease RecJ [Hyphomicrobiales bacterium]
MNQQTKHADRRFFLDVASSVSGKAWRPRLESERSALALAERHELPELLARVLAGREVDAEDVENFLKPTLKALMPAPDALRDLEEGAERIAHAITQDEKLAIIGDYDVDGATSSALLLLFLRACGRDAAVHIPNRLTEGYGPSKEAIEKLAGDGAKLLITLDCGISSFDPLSHARVLGLDVVIIDHHQAGESLPAANAVVNPNRQDDVSGQGHLAAVGVTFLMVATVARNLRKAGWFSDERQQPNLLEWLDLVALGTVCDMVPLTGLNRAFVGQGLKVMGTRSNKGLARLCDVARLSRRPDAHALGFALGPRINAAGRLGQSGLGMKLLTTKDESIAAEISQALERLNRERQDIEVRIVNRAMVQAEDAIGAKGNLPALVVAGENWHPGVLGLVASRLKERFNLPAIAIGYGDGQAQATGSGRSITGVDLGTAIRKATEAGILVKGGGHAMAAGLTLDISKLGEFRAFLEDALAKDTGAARSQASLEIDGALTARSASLDLIAQLEAAGPFGIGNPAPVFALPAHRIVYADLAGTDHVRCTLAASDGARLQAIAFRSVGTELGELLLSERQMPVHIAGRLNINDWGGKRTPQFLIADAAVPTSQ